MIGYLKGDIWRAIALFLAVMLLAALIQIHGLPIIGGGLKADLAGMTALRADEVRSHQQTKDNYRAAQLDAARKDAFRLIRVKAEQERANHDREAAANASLDALRHKYERMLSQARTGAAGAAGGQPMPGLPTPAFGADAAAAEDGLSLAERYECSVSATQLDELISWVGAQAAIDVNSSPED